MDGSTSLLVQARLERTIRSGQRETHDPSHISPEKWEELITSLSRTTFYDAPPSRDDLAAIIKVFGDSELCLNSNLMHETHHLTQPTVDIGLPARMVTSSASANAEAQCNRASATNVEKRSAVAVIRF